MRFLSKHDFDREATALSKALLMLHQQEECVDNDGSTLNQWTLTEADSPDLYLIHPPIHRRSATHKRDPYDVPIEEVLGDEEQQVRIDDVTVVATPTHNAISSGLSPSSTVILGPCRCCTSGSYKPMDRRSVGKIYYRS